MDDTNDNDTPEITTTDPEMRQLLGLFDVPAYARRGQELDFALTYLQSRCRRERNAMLDMVRLRMKQWARVSQAGDDGADLFESSLHPLWQAVAPIDESWPWGASLATSRRRVIAARDLAASVERFNRRWPKFVKDLDVAPINLMIDRYNEYYLLEKECAFGSSRVAARHFRPARRLTPEVLLEDHPLLPSVVLRPPGAR